MPLLNGLENNPALHDKYKRTGDKEAESERERDGKTEGKRRASSSQDRLIIDLKMGVFSIPL